MTLVVYTRPISNRSPVHPSLKHAETKYEFAYFTCDHCWPMNEMDAIRLFFQTTAIYCRISRSVKYISDLFLTFSFRWAREMAPYFFLFEPDSLPAAVVSASPRLRWAYHSQMLWHRNRNECIYSLGMSRWFCSIYHFRQYGPIQIYTLFSKPKNHLSLFVHT